MFSDVVKDSFVGAAYFYKCSRITELFCLLRHKAIESIIEAVLEIG